MGRKKRKRHERICVMTEALIRDLHELMLPDCMVRFERISMTLRDHDIVETLD